MSTLVAGNSVSARAVDPEQETASLNLTRAVAVKQPFALLNKRYVVDRSGQPISRNMSAQKRPLFSLELSGVSTVHEHPVPPRVWLLGLAERQIGVLAETTGLSVTDVAKQRAMRLLDSLVVAGQPPPQVTRNPSGAVETNWLVNSEFVVLAVENTGEWSMWAEGAEGEELFAFEGESGELMSESDCRVARDVLDRLGRSIEMWHG